MCLNIESRALEFATMKYLPLWLIIALFAPIFIGVQSKEVSPFIIHKSLNREPYGSYLINGMHYFRKIPNKETLPFEDKLMNLEIKMGELEDKNRQLKREIDRLLHRSCEEMRQWDQFAESGNYFIDPDGVYQGGNFSKVSRKII